MYEVLNRVVGATGAQTTTGISTTKEGGPVLDIHITGSGTVAVAVRGELDMHHAPRLRAALTALINRGDVVEIDIDLSGVTFLDATGVGTIIVAHRIATNVRVRLRLTAVSPLTDRLLTLAGAEALLPARRPIRSDPSRVPSTRRRMMPARRPPPAGHGATHDGRAPTGAR